MPADLDTVLADLLAKLPNIPSLSQQHGNTPFDKSSQDMSLMTERLDKLTKALDERFSGAEAFATSELAKTMGVSNELTKRLLEARAAQGDPLAKAKLDNQAKTEQEERSKANRERFKGGMGHLEQGLMPGGRTGGGQVAELFKGVGMLAGLIPGRAGRITEGIMKFGEGLFKGVDKLQKWGNQLHEFNMQFAEFSGKMMGVQVQSDLRNMKLARERGDNLAESAQTLAEGRDALNRRMSGITDFIDKRVNYVVGGLSSLVDAVGEKLGIGRDKETEGKGLWQEAPAQLFEMGRKHWTETYGASDAFKLEDK